MATLLVRRPQWSSRPVRASTLTGRTCGKWTPPALLPIPTMVSALCGIPLLRYTAPQSGEGTVLLEIAHDGLDFSALEASGEVRAAASSVHLSAQERRQLVGRCAFRRARLLVVERLARPPGLGPHEGTRESQLLGRQLGFNIGGLAR